MKLTLSQLKRIIKEEVQRSLKENVDADMITVEVDVSFESGEYSDKEYDGPEEAFVAGQDVTELAPEYVSITPDKLIIVDPEGPGGGNPVCHASFYKESRARIWFANLMDDDDDAFFDSCVVN